MGRASTPKKRAMRDRSTKGSPPASMTEFERGYRQYAAMSDVLAASTSPPDDPSKHMKMWMGLLGSYMDGRPKAAPKSQKQWGYL